MPTARNACANAVFSVEAAQAWRRVSASTSRRTGASTPMSSQRPRSRISPTFFRDSRAISARGCRTIFARRLEHPEPAIRWRPLLTENVHPQILVGYGDPAVFKDGDDYWLVATSNDAPDAFPLLHSTDLDHWEPQGFHLSRRATSPAGPPKAAMSPISGRRKWPRRATNIGCASPPGRPAMRSRSGLREAPSPLGPWVDNGAPLITGRPLDTTGSATIRPSRR